MDSYGLLWTPMDSYGLLWTPMDSYGLLWVPSSQGQVKALQRLIMSLYKLHLLWTPMDSTSSIPYLHLKHPPLMDSHGLHLYDSMSLSKPPPPMDSYGLHL